MPDRMLAEFVRGFEALGFCSVEGAPRSHNRDRLYKHKRSTGDVSYFASLEYKPKLKTFALGIGISSPPAMSLLKHSLPLILRFAHPAVERMGLATLPCWKFFDVGRALDWYLLSIPGPNDRENWRAQLTALTVEFLEPVFWPIESADGIVDLLLRNDKPFEWFAGNSVLRVAEIVALSRFATYNWEDTLSRIGAFEKQIVKDMQGAKNLREMTDALSRSLFRSH